MPAQTFYLTEQHCKMLKEEENVEAWCFEQHENEAVFIPAGCPHQVLIPDLLSCAWAVHIRSPRQLSCVVVLVALASHFGPQLPPESVEKTVWQGLPDCIHQFRVPDA